MAVLIQRHWRGYRARKNWRILKACIRIQLKWRSYKSKKYFFVLFKTFEVPIDPIAPRRLTLATCAPPVGGG